MANEPPPKNTNEPENSDFKQQRLKAWQPILTPKWVILTFASVGVVFLAIGIAVIMASNEVVELKSDDYTGKQSTSGQWAGCVGAPTSASSGTNATSCLVEQSLTVAKDMKAPIYMYYELTHFYQNHRRYVKSRSDTQLRGDDNYATTGCDPKATRACKNKDGTKSGTCAIYPCGLIAWSVFNDTFYYAGATSKTSLSTDSVLVTPKTGASKSVKWTSSGIAWKSDKEKKFITTTDAKAMPPGSQTGTPSDANTIAMPYDNFKYYKCKGGGATCDVSKRYADVGNEEFIVWMRTSGLPEFRKLHRIINTDLKEGDKLTFLINNIFPVKEFSGTKKIVLSTTTWIGGKNSFLGWAYIVVAILCILLALGFFIKEMVCPRQVASSEQLEHTG